MAASHVADQEFVVAVSHHGWDKTTFQTCKWKLWHLQEIQWDENLKQAKINNKEVTSYEPQEVGAASLD